MRDIVLVDHVRQRGVQRADLVRREDRFALANLEFLHVAARVAGRPPCPQFSEIESLAEQCDARVRCSRLVDERAVHREDIGARDRVDALLVAEERHDVQAPDCFVVCNAARFFERFRMLAHVAIAQIEHRGCDLLRVLFSGGILAFGNGREHLAREIASLVGGDVAAACDGGFALGAVRGAVARNVGLSAAGLDSDSKPGEICVPKPGVFLCWLGVVDDFFREFRHSWSRTRLLFDEPYINQI
nr:hypothetical protein [Caballeronia pedi]